MLKLSPNQRRYSELFLQWKERLYRSRRTDHVSKNDDDGFGILSHQFLHHLEIKQKKFFNFFVVILNILAD